MELEDVEIYVPPEIASKLEPGSVMTLEVGDRQAVGKGWLIRGSGTVQKAEKEQGEGKTGDRLETPVVAGDLEYEAQLDLVGSVGNVDVSKKVLSFQARDAATAPPEKSSSAESGTEQRRDEIAERIETSLPPETQKKLAEHPEQFIHREKAPEQLELGLEFESDPVLSSKPEGIPKPSFGERGPQLIGMDPEEKPRVEEGAVDEKPEQAGAFQSQGICSVEEFYKFLEGVDENDPAAQVSQRPLGRSEAVAMEKEGMLRAGPQMFIANMSGGQLVLPDIDVRMRFGDSYNLARIPSAKLKRSSDLFEAIQKGLVKFVTSQEASDRLKKTERRLLRMEQDIGGVEVYDHADDVYDDIGFGEPGDEYDYDDRPRRHESSKSRSRHPDDPMPRFDVEPRVRKAQELPESREFRRGIRSRSRRGRYSDDYYDDYDDGYGDPNVGRLRRASVNRAPRRFREMGDMDVLHDDRGEMDAIFEGVEQREAEIEQARSAGRDPFEADDALASDGRPQEAPDSGSGDDDYDYGNPGREIDEFRRESYREDREDRHVRVNRVSW